MYWSGVVNLRLNHILYTIDQFKFRLATACVAIANIKMQVTSLLLAAIATAQSPGIAMTVCTELDHILNHAMQSASMDNFVTLIQISLSSYCYNGEWIKICSPRNQLVTDEIMAACTQLGYSDSGSKLAVVNGGKMN